MKVKIEKVSTTTLIVTLNEVLPSIDDGIIKLQMFIAKDNISDIMDLPYIKGELLYKFQLSKKLPYNTSEIYCKIVTIGDNGVQDETKKILMFKKNPHHLSGVMKKIRHDFKIVAKNYNGSKAFLFKKIPGDTACSSCWDNDLRSSSNSNCPICGGTGKMVYFSKPYPTICGPLKWQNEAHTTGHAGKEIVSPQASLSTIADLNLTTDDIVFHINSGDFLRVIARTLSELKSASVLQSLIVNIIPSGHPDSEICERLIEEMS